MAIKVIRLVTNEEIIGEVEEGQDEYEISKPAVLGFISDDVGKPNMVLQKYLPHSEEGDDATIVVSRNHVLFSFNPLDEIVEHYNQILG